MSRHALSLWVALALAPACVGLAGPRAGARARWTVAARSTQGFLEPEPLDEPGDGRWDAMWLEGERRDAAAPSAALRDREADDAVGGAGGAVGGAQPPVSVVSLEPDGVLYDARAVAGVSGFGRASCSCAAAATKPVYAAAGASVTAPPIAPMASATSASAGPLVGVAPPSS